MPEEVLKGLVSGLDIKFKERETCDENSPHLITYVETTLSTNKDHEVMENLHEALNDQNLSPSQHLVDAGYIDSELLVTSRKNHQIDLIGPAPGDSQWQAREGKGFGLTDFKIDWKNQVAYCPKEKISHKWKPRLNR